MTTNSTRIRRPLRHGAWVFLWLFVCCLAIGSFLFLSPANMPGTHTYYSPLPPILTTHLFRLHLLLRGWGTEQTDSPYKLRSYSNPNMIVPPGGCASSDVLDVQIEPGRGLGSLVYVQAYPITVCE